MERKKFSKIIIIVIGIIIVLFIAALAVYLKNPGDQTPQAEDADLFPFNAPGLPTNQDDDRDTSPDDRGAGGGTITTQPTLLKITDFPVAGHTIIETEEQLAITQREDASSTEETIRYVDTVNYTLYFSDKRTGHIFEKPYGEETTQLTKTELPGLYEMLFNETGSQIIARYFNTTQNTIETFVATIPKETEVVFCTTPFTQELTTGSRGAEVIALQQFINVTLNTSITTDGVFGGGTAAALRDLQKTIDVPVTGIVDTETRKELTTLCELSRTKQTAQIDEPRELSGNFWDTNISWITPSQTSDNIFYIKKTTDGTVGVLGAFDQQTMRQVFTSPFSEWLPQWISSDLIALQTQASGESGGYLYFLETNTGNLRKIIDGTTGLTTLVNPLGDAVLYSEGGSIATLALNMLSVANNTVTELPIVTLPEKCVWENAASVLCAVPEEFPQATYPDAWYQDRISFEDSLWRISIQGDATLVSNLSEEAEEPLDAVHLELSSDNKRLGFINKTTGELWHLVLEK